MIKKLQALKAKKGFTLVELIVVIAIIGVLAAILVPTMLGYVTSSRVTSANSTAASIKNNVDAFLTKADTNGYGMKQDKSQNSTLIFEVNNSTWKCTVGSASAFKPKTGDPVQWTGGQSVSEGMSVNTISNDAASMLALELCNLFPELDKAYVWVYLEGGKALYCYYTAESGSALSGTPAASNFSAGSFSWNNKTAGVTSDGYIVGTAPALNLG